MLYIYIVCVKDTYPKGLKANCKRLYSCARLQRNKMCTKKYAQAMNNACKNQLSKWLQGRPVRNFCKKSCRTCIRKFSNNLSHLYILLDVNIIVVLVKFIHVIPI